MKVRLKSVNIVVRTFGDFMTAVWGADHSFAILLQPIFQAGFAKCMKTVEDFRLLDFTELFLAQRTFNFFLNIIKKALALSHDL